jgi:protein-serine/threonine kinase
MANSSDVVSQHRVDHDEISQDTFTKLGLLGKGAVGKCYLVREKGTNQLYAMKVMGKADIMQRLKGNRIMLEREVMTMSKHPLVVSLHISFQSTDFLYHVMEYCPGAPYTRK